jgi:hypothetical protein
MMVMRYIKYTAFVFVCTLLLSEVLLRFLGYKPGVLMPPRQIVDRALNFSDTLYLLRAFLPDSSGIMKFNPAYDTANFDVDFSQFNPVLRSRIKQHVLNVPINSNGFQDEEFATKDTAGKKKVMLLGDSFTWGYSAEPGENSFANLLGQEKGIATYNLAVPASDLATYLKLTQLYVPKLKPDYLIVNFYISNDFLYYRKELKPFKYPDVYPTNVGGFYTMNYETIGKDSIELFDSYRDAYQYTAGKFTWRGEQNSFLQELMKHSALVAQLVRTAKGYYTPHVNSTFVPAVNCTREYLLQIDSICETTNTRFILAVINNGNEDNTAEIEECRKHFGDFPFYMPAGMNKPVDYIPSPDGHFNNLGHKKYEQFLLRILQGKEKRK